MDYGAIGAVIGHEVSHSFDNQGALFDAKGRLHNWWTPDDFKHFEASAAQLVAQYDAYKPFPDLAIKGQQTLGENIADVAGLAAAYDAYHRSLGGKPAPAVGRLHRRPAVLRQLRPDLARQVPGARAAEPDRRPTATRRTSTAPSPCGTSTRGTGRSA